MPFIGVQPSRGLVGTAGIDADAVTNAKIADDQIDSEHYVNGSIDTAHIAANAIDGTLTKDALIADYSDVTITAADLIMYGDATDSNNTKRDTVQGILDLAGSPDYGIKLQTVTADDDSTVAVTGFNNSTYKDYIIRFRSIVPATDGGVIFHMKTSTDGGSSYDPGSSNYSWINARGHHSGSGIHTANSSGDTETELTAGSLGSDTAESLSGWIEVLNAPDGTNYSHLQGLLVLADHNATTSTQFWFSASRNTAADIDAVQFYFASGNVESGDFVLYGIK